jgi:hypothetical protein
MAAKQLVIKLEEEDARALHALSFVTQETKNKIVIAAIKAHLHSPAVATKIAAATAVLEPEAPPAEAPVVTEALGEDPTE